MDFSSSTFSFDCRTEQELSQSAFLTQTTATTIVNVIVFVAVVDAVIVDVVEEMAVIVSARCTAFHTTHNSSG